LFSAQDKQFQKNITMAEFPVRCGFTPASHCLPLKANQRLYQLFFRGEPFEKVFERLGPVAVFSDNKRILPFQTVRQPGVLSTDIHIKRLFAD
jgi:hypothetical protein